MLNKTKTNEIVFHRPNPRNFNSPPHLLGIERVTHLKLLGVIIANDLSFKRHVNYIVQICYQRLCLPKQLKQPGLPSDKLNNVLDAIILTRFLYAVQSWSGFLSYDNVNCVDASLSKAHRWQLTSSCKCFSDLTDDLLKLFRASSQSHHCFNLIFEPMRKYSLSQLNCAEEDIRTTYLTGPDLRFRGAMC